MSAPTATTTLEQELRDPPADGITSVIFAHGSSDWLLASSWDNTVRLYDTHKNALVHTFTQPGAVLDTAFTADDTVGYSGGVDCRLAQHDLGRGTSTVLGRHGKAIKCVNYSATTNLIFTGSWDTTIRYWDARAAQAHIGTINLPGKVFSMDVVGNRLVVGTSGRHVQIHDLRQVESPEQVRESSLMNQTRCIRCFPDGKGYALSSIEGRVAVELFDPSPEAQQRKYAFKCHRKTEGRTQILYPVNSLAFHPVYGTFASGGCDGCIKVWDGAHRKRICEYPSYPTSIASMAFNHDGSKLAIAASYTFEQGECDHPPEAIYVRSINDGEVRPRVKGASKK